LYVQLLDPDTSVALLRGTSIEDFTRLRNPRLLAKAKRYRPDELSAEAALAMVL